jgi:hypothetical protein
LGSGQILHLHGALAPKPFVKVCELLGVSAHKVQAIAALGVNLRHVLCNGGGGTNNEHSLHERETVRDLA